MNCVKCPITDECKVGKMTMMQDNLEGVSVPTKVMPFNPGDCLLVKVLATVEELKCPAQGVESNA